MTTYSIELSRMEGGAYRVDRIYLVINNRYLVIS